MSFNKDDFYFIHKKFISKSIEELQFEEVLKIDCIKDHFSLDTKDNISYHFKAEYGVWDNIQIDAKTLSKYKNGQQQVNFTVYDFFKEIQHICEMSDDTLSKFLEEANQTIFSDLKLLDNNKLSMKELITKDYLFVEQTLFGHPKLIMNKGRIGWGQDEIIKYAPEFRSSFQLMWVAVSKEIVDSGFSKDYSNQDLYSAFLDLKATKDIDLDAYHIMAIHPWQWNKYIKNQFIKEIINSQIIKLGFIGDEFSPQASIRTLSSISKDNKLDIKLSLSILNTSCVRGIPGKYISDGYKISECLGQIIQEDSFLKDKVEILKEVGAIKVKSDIFDDLEKASYRYKELLGCIWRESVNQKINKFEKAIPTASLFYKNQTGSFMAKLIKESKLSSDLWLKKYFEVVVLPLYHLQIEHGLGLVSHGQNTILVLEENVPHRLIIKDFHGDLRISKKSKHLKTSAFRVLDSLNPEHLIHDLITGHFITVLRYVSRVLKDFEMISEKSFYKILGECILDYHAEHSPMDDSISLLREHFEKILVNKVRFIAGYNETSLRLKPLLGKELSNPLAKGASL